MLDVNSATNPAGAVSGDTRVICGAGWDFPPRGARSAFCLGCDPDFRGGSLGFRVARAMFVCGGQYSATKVR